MARGMKRKAMEELTPNSLPAIDFVRPRPTEIHQHHTLQAPQQPHIFARFAMSARGAAMWLLNSFYTTTTTNQNRDVVTETHVQVVRSNPQSNTSIKRLKTTNSVPTMSSKSVRKQKQRSRSEANRGGVGPVDTRGCTAEVDLERVVDDFWLPQDWSKPKKKDAQQAKQDSSDEGDGEDAVMADSDEELRSAQMKEQQQSDYSTSNVAKSPTEYTIPGSSQHHDPWNTKTMRIEKQTMNIGMKVESRRQPWTAISRSEQARLHVKGIDGEDELSQDIGSLLLTERVDNKSTREKVPKSEEPEDEFKDELQEIKIEPETEVGRDSKAPTIKRPLKGILKKKSKYELQESSKRDDTHLRSSQDATNKRIISARLREQQEREAAAKAKKEARLYRRQPNGPLVKRLNTNWATIVSSVMSSQGTITTSLGGTPLQPKDFRTLLGHRSWLNDEIINTYIEWVVDAANREAEKEAKEAGEKASTVPKFIAHNSFFYETLSTKGPQTTARLMKRKKAPGLSLLEVDSVFVPICKGSHWTLGVVRPFAKTIEYFDSMGGGSAHLVKLMRDWLAFQLGSDYVADEWKVPQTRCAVQNNGYDCGVFVCTNAFCVTAGIDTSSYLECHMTQQRQNIAAILINRGFVGDFAWREQV